MTTLSQIGAWLLAGAVALAALGPARYRPRLWITHYGEHALAFILVGLAFALAYPRQRLLVAVMLIVLTGLLELVQLLIPGRHARLNDWLVDVLAALIGVALVAMIDRFMRAH